MTKSIDDILKDMPLDAKVKEGLKESWNSALADAKVAQEGEVREELSARYEQDLARIKEAFSQYLEERVKPHVAELQEGVSQVEALKSQYADKVATIKENARSMIRKRMGALQKVIESKVREELSELHEDVVANRRAALNAITEKKSELEKERQKFRTQAARVLEQIVNVKIPKQLDELREDIKAARRDSFGREIYEAFAATFRTQFHNSSKEFKALSDKVQKLEESNKKIKARAQQELREAKSAATKAVSEKKKLQESVARSQAMTRLLQPLKGVAREKMKALLEATRTENLDKTFRKSYPQIVREANASNKRHARRKPLAERKVEVRSGSSDLTESNKDDFEDEIIEISRLAGTRR